MKNSNILQKKGGRPKGSKNKIKAHWKSSLSEEVSVILDFGRDGFGEYHLGKIDSIRGVEKLCDSPAYLLGYEKGTEILRAQIAG